jgi:hypothetical protein
VTVGDFVVAADGGASRCPAGLAPARQEVRGQQPGRPTSGRVVLGLLLAACAACDVRAGCPATRDGRADGRGEEVVLTFSREEHCLESRRRYQTSEAFRERAALRAGIEATNSELKRRHGLGALRVRGRGRVEQAVLLKAAACNVKRAAIHLAQHPPARPSFPSVN